MPQVWEHIKSLKQTTMLLKMGIYSLYGIVSTTCSRYKEQSDNDILQVNTSRTQNLLEDKAKK